MDEFYSLLGDALYRPLDLNKVRQVDIFEEFCEAFYQESKFEEPCLVKLGGSHALEAWTNTTPQINIEQAWIFYWASGKISCESMVGGDVLGMFELLLAEKLSTPIAAALRFAFLAG